MTPQEREALLRMAQALEELTDCLQAEASLRIDYRTLKMKRACRDLAAVLYPKGEAQPVDPAPTEPMHKAMTSYTDLH